ncbi:hypothetical protein P8C59_000149 [Phyllachora maydis]|uniref:Uncharacterized protein n=1 Tax=Phyllachora maydis TaxID=1825666 RepID=A0AAD9HWT3_9PEZI|nr:hypothetical protein P8C59_000149 [Phyllachora maydis]
MICTSSSSSSNNSSSSSSNNSSSSSSNSSSISSTNSSSISSTSSNKNAGGNARIYTKDKGGSNNGNNDNNNSDNPNAIDATALRRKEEAEEEAVYKAEIAIYKAYLSKRAKHTLPTLLATKKAALAAIHCFLELRSNLAIKAKRNSAKYALVLVDEARTLVERSTPIIGITPM